MKWTAADLPDIEGRTVVVTGANSGLGLITATELARVGAHVVLAVRNTDKGAKAAASMTGSTEVRSLDLADLSSVRTFVDQWSAPIDILINNAGVMLLPKSSTADGFEMHIGTNYLGHFALTAGLLPLVQDRVISLGSITHRYAELSLDDLNWENRRYNRMKAYGASKLAAMLFSLELQRRLTTSGSTVRSMAAHPGYASSDGASHLGNPVGDSIFGLGGRLLAQSIEAGARSTLFAATADIPGGSYVGPDGLQELRGHPTLVGRTTTASDPELAKELWTLSESLCG